LAEAHDNVLVTRTFSKIFGLAGERIGWATGAPAIIATLNRIRGPFNVSATGQAMALAALGDTAFVEASRVHNQSERARFVEKLEALGNHGLRPLPSQANFVLVLFEGALSAEAAFEGLADRGYIVRWLPGQGLPQALRFTIGKAEDMDTIAAALRAMAEGVK
jgi:histidinol-phosphate aminotransferase